MKYSDSEDDHVYDINLKKGQQHLDGKTALQNVRFRMTLCRTSLEQKDNGSS